MHLDIHLLLCDFCSLCYEGTVPSHQINIYLYFPSRFRQFHLSTSIFHPSDIYCGGGCCSVAKSCPTLCNPMDCSQPGSSDHGILRARILEWVAMPSSQGSFPTQGLNLGLPHCRQILYRLSHQGSPRILEWVAYPFSRGSSQPGY